MAINTKKVADRREVRFASLAELRADVERLRDAAGGGGGNGGGNGSGDGSGDGDRSGSVQALGNWSLGQASQHLARFMVCSIDGFDKAPFFLRPMGMMLQLFQGQKVLNQPPPPGFKIPSTLAFFPDAEVDDAAGSAELLAVIDRLLSGTECVHPSPLLGKLSPEQWTKLHLRHAELHLSFFKV